MSEGLSRCGLESGLGRERGSRFCLGWTPRGKDAGWKRGKLEEGNA